MNVIELRNKTIAARAIRVAAEDAEFNVSPLRKYIDRRIQEAADNGEGILTLNFYCAKECAPNLKYGKYGRPTIATVLRHYQSEGFKALSERTNIIISWM